MRRRLDAELVRRGLATSRERARQVIAAGRVTVGGAPALKPATLVDPGDALAVSGPSPRFVGRGGEKLEAALARFGVVVDGRRAVDAGASTGGFTDCLLQRGAAEVVAIDVGYGLLHERLRAHPRVRVLERTNVRTVTAAGCGGPADVVVADLSFISLRLVAPTLVTLLRPGGDMVVLVKPQFEAGRADVSRGRGVIRDPEVWRSALERVASAFLGAGAAIMGAMASPLPGAEGNREFFLHVRTDTAAADPGPVLDAAVVEAGGV